MTTAEFVMDAPAPHRRPGPLRYFFVGMVIVATVVLGVAFVPE